MSTADRRNRRRMRLICLDILRRRRAIETLAFQRLQQGTP